MTFDTGLDSGSEGSSPYPGERPFNSADQDFFWGREAERAEVKTLWLANSVVVLHGAAGCGKTSLLQAGLTPALRGEGDILPVAHASLGSPFPEAALSDHNPYTLSILSSWSPAESRTKLSRLSLTGFFSARVLTHAWPARKPLMFAAIDQLEEVFRDGRRSQHRDEFFKDLSEALRIVPQLRIVLSIRNEYLSSLAQYRELLEISDQAYMSLSILQKSAAIEAVTLPMEKVGYEFAPGVAEELVDDLFTTSLAAVSRNAASTAVEGVEPIQLQIVCSNLFQALPSGVSLVTFDLSDVGSYVDWALAKFYSDVLSAVAVEHEISIQRLRDWLERTFITSRRTRRIIPEGQDSTANMSNSVLRELENRHLLTAEWRSAKRWYTLANDRLVSAIRQQSRTPQNEIRPAMDASGHLRVAVNVMAAGELPLAEKHAWHALKTAGGADLRLQADARSLLGNLAFKRGQLDVAAEQYRLSAALCEQLGDQWAVGRLIGAIGRINARRGRYIAALEDLQSAVMRVPDDLTLRTELANVLWSTGQAQAAAAIFGTVLSIEPEFTEALAGRGQIQAESGNASSALEDIGALQRLRPTARLEPEVRSAYALALARLGKPESAMEEATAVLSEADDNGPILLRVARVATASGAQDRAAALLHQAQKASHPALSFDQLNEARRLLSSVETRDQ
jgi:tetratricopeptide (TPR) repeat protein